MTRPVIMPQRGFGRGVKMRAVHTAEHGWCYVLADIERYGAGAHWSQIVAVDGVVDENGERLVLVTGDDALLLLQEAPMALKGDDHDELVAWLERNLAGLREDTERLVGYALDEDPGYTQRHFTVANAAAILNRDPAITLGRDRLFEVLAHVGWIERPHLDWRPTDDARRAGLVTARPTMIHGRKDVYMQVVVTDAALLELHRRLGGITPLTIGADDTIPTLVDGVL